MHCVYYYLREGEGKKDQSRVIQTFIYLVSNQRRFGGAGDQLCPKKLRFGFVEAIEI